MAGLFEGSAPNPVTLTASTKQEAPAYLTNYLQNLASAGMGALGTVTPGVGSAAPTVTPFTSKELIADLPDFYKNLMTPTDASKLPTLADLTRYKDATAEALTAGKSAMDVGAADISKFYDPYQQQVIDEMQRQSDINVQRNVIPALRALGMSGAGGAAGTKRGYDISGQALADIASTLQSQQTGARSAGFKQALEAALREQGQQASAASALGQLGSIEQQAATQGIKSLSEAGASKLAYDQSKIEAPLTRAMNVAQIMRQYQYPTTTSESKQVLPTIMGSSPLSQIAGLGSLIGAAFPTDPKTGKIGGLGGFLGGLFKSGATGQAISDEQWAANPDWAGYGG